MASFSNGADRNNVLAASASGLNLDSKDTSALLSNPQSFLAKVSGDEAAKIRAIVIPAYRRAFRIIFLTGASLAVLAFFIALFLMPQVELSRPDDEKLKEEARQREEEKKCVC